jgi:hypothetical protein
MLQQYLKTREQAVQELCKFQGVQCQIPVFKHNICKKHFVYQLKKHMRREMSTIYRDPQSAYATFDFTGSGKIALKDILNHQVIKKMHP